MGEIEPQCEESTQTEMKPFVVREEPKQNPETSNMEDSSFENKEENHGVENELEILDEIKANTNSISLNDETKLINTSRVLDSVQQEIVFTSRDDEYADAYMEYQLPEEEGRAFVLTPRQREAIEEVIPTLSQEILNNLSYDNVKNIVTEWGAGSTISSILSKGLVLESIKYSRYIAKVVTDGLREESISIPKVCELCVGAGITSSNLYLQWKNSEPEKSIQIHAVDNSVESVATAIAVFKSQGVPHMLLKDPKDLEKVSKSFEGVVLVIQDALEFLDTSNTKYDAYVSENGISYFDPQKHEIAITNLLKNSHPGTLVAIASLNPTLLVALEKPFLIKEILTGKDKRKQYLERAQKGEPQYVVKDGKIVKALTLEAGGQIELMRYLLWNDFPTFLSYMKGLLKATKAAEVLIREIKSPIPVSEEILKRNNLYNSASDWNIKGSPCDVLVTKV